MKTKFRNHPSLLVEQMGRFWAVIFVIFILNFDWKEWQSIIRDIRKTGDFTPIIAVLIMLGIFILYTLITTIHWYKTWIIIDETSITIAVNTINKSSNTIGLKNISNVNIQRNIFEMLIGTCKIKIDTDSRSTANSTDVSIVLKKEQAEKLRQHLMNASKENTAPEASPETESEAGTQTLQSTQAKQVSPVYNVYYDNKKVLTHCIYTAPITGIVMTLIGLIGLTVFVVTQIIQKGLGLQSMLALVAKSAVAGSTFILFYAGAAYSLIKDFFKYYHFRAQRIDDRIQIEFGLFKQGSYEVPVERINSIIIQKSVISRLTRRCCVDLINVGIGDEKGENTRLLLSIPDKHLAEILHRLLPEFDDYFDDEAVSDSIRQPHKIWWKHGFGACMLLIAAAIAFVILWQQLIVTPLISTIYWTVVAAITVFFMMGCYSAYRATKLQLHENYLAVSSGIFAMTTQFVRYRKIQYMELNESLTERILHLQSGTIHILASAEKSMVTIPSFDKQKIQPLISLFTEDAKRARGA